MKRILLAISLSASCLCSIVAGQNPPTPPWEMTSYQLGLLVRGPQWTAERTEETDRIQKGHMAHLQTMASAGKLVGAGPLADGGSIRGILIFKAASIDEAKTLAEADPAVKSGRLVLEIHPWLGPAEIGSKYFKAVKENPGTAVEMMTYQLVLSARGPEWTAESGKQMMGKVNEHFAHLKKLREAGKLAAAGPILDHGKWHGVFVFTVASAEEARLLAEADPIVKTGLIILEIHPWMAAKGLFP